MSAADDYLDRPRIDMYDEIDRLRAQNDGLANIGLRLTETIERMQQWKAEATQVIEEWDRVWEAAGCPGRLGAPKAKSVSTYVHYIPGVNDRFHAQVERDRPVIEAAQAWSNQWPKRPGVGRLNGVLWDAVAACAPDEVDEVET